MRAEIDERVMAAASRIGADLLVVADRSIVGVYVHGSAVLGDFVPQASDLDLLVVADDNIAPHSTDDIGRVLAASDPSPAVGVEASIVTRSAAMYPQAPWPFLVHVTNHPANVKIMSGDDRGGDPDLILHYAVLRQHGWNVSGPESTAVFGAVDRATIVGQLAAELRWSADNAPQSYAVLNTCRALRFVAEGTLCSKTEGGHWALSAGIETELVEHSLKSRGEGTVDTVPLSVAAREWVLSTARTLQVANKTI